MNRMIEIMPKSTKWVYIFNGLVNTAVGVNMIAQYDQWTPWSILAILLVVAGPIFFFYGLLLLFNPKNILVPKVALDHQGLSIKNDIHKKVIKIHWADIKEITYKSFELDFLLNNKQVESVKLPTSAEKSIEIKKSIREFSEEQNITIIGG